MKTILVPVDFSKTSVNAAKYATHMAALMDNAKVILYNVYEKVTLKTLSEYSRKAVAELELSKLKELVMHRGLRELTWVAEEGVFIPKLKHFVAENDVDLIVMGITGSSGLRQILMGSNSLNVVKNVNCPVMIIPPKAAFSGLKNIAITSDFKDVALTTPFDTVKKVLSLFNSKVHVVNVDEEHYIELKPEYRKEKAFMEKKLGSFNPEFYFLRTYDFLDGINRFVKTKHVDALITIPKQHSFLEQLFRVTHTKRLAYHSHVPLLAVHQ